MGRLRRLQHGLQRQVRIAWDGEHQWQALPLHWRAYQRHEPPHWSTAPQGRETWPRSRSALTHRRFLLDRFDFRSHVRAVCHGERHGSAEPLYSDQAYVPSPTGGVILSPTENVVGLAAELIDNPFPNDLRAGARVHIDDIPGAYKWRQWTEVLLQSESVIVTRSPPVQDSFQSLAKMASSVAMGAWVGTQAASALGQPILMFLTVPAGMVIISAASGLGKALETGLYEWLSRKLSAPEEPQQHHPPPPTSRRRTASPKGKAEH
jgi:hypothetical protein